MEDSRDIDILAVTTTVGSRAAALALAHEILDRRLAACVQCDEGVTSLYRWKGELCEDPEVRLTIKTVPGCVPALQALFEHAHPYELPQFAAVPMKASRAYGEWVRSETSAPAESAG